jgi:hypothetical protein
MTISSQALLYSDIFVEKEKADVLNSKRINRGRILSDCQQIYQNDKTSYLCSTENYNFPSYIKITPILSIYSTSPNDIHYFTSEAYWQVNHRLGRCVVTPRIFSARTQ